MYTLFVPVQQNGTLKCAYTYLADGTKVMAQDNASSSSSNGYLYLGSMVFKKTGTGYAFESTDFGGGRIINVNGTLSPYYYATDHLGSVRAITDASGNVTERNDYYAFGKRMTTGGSYPVMTSNRWKYNGKEVQTTGNVNWLDYGAREYDEVIARWTRPDPMSEKYYGTSGYTYCVDNPISLIDSNGDSVIVNNVGYISRDDQKDNSVYLQENNEIIFLGKIGGTINANKIYSNLLNKDISVAKKMLNPFIFKSLVKDNGSWDFKNDKNSIFGLANDNKTYFEFHNEKMNSQDIGNHHFGAVSRAFGFPKLFSLFEAGRNQMKKNLSKSIWQPKLKVNIPSSIIYFNIPLPPFGDDPEDQKYIIEGFSYYDKWKERQEK